MGKMGRFCPCFAKVSLRAVYRKTLVKQGQDLPILPIFIII